MNLEILKYLREHKDNYDLEVLKKELIKAGHKVSEINEVINEFEEEEKILHFEEISPFPDPNKKYHKTKNIIKKPIQEVIKIEKKEKKPHINDKKHRKLYNPLNLIYIIAGISILGLLSIISIFI